ncbi:MAG: type VII toxin-antitoxin system HepT family RNase toxin [Bacillota bacterium]
MVDRDLLRHKLHLLSRSIAKLDKYRNISLAELAGNEERRDAIERVLHVAVQSCLDIGNHVIADLDLREPADYKDIMVILTEAGILPKEKAKQFTRMAQFRNVIVHQYDEIDPAIILSILQKDIGDLRLFGQAIKDYFQL